MSICPPQLKTLNIRTVHLTNIMKAWWYVINKYYLGLSIGNGNCQITLSQLLLSQNVGNRICEVVHSKTFLWSVAMYFSQFIHLLKILSTWQLWLFKGELEQTAYLKCLNWAFAHLQMVQFHSWPHPGYLQQYDGLLALAAQMFQPQHHECGKPHSPKQKVRKFTTRR